MEHIAISVPMRTSIEVNSDTITNESIIKVLNGEVQDHTYTETNTILVTLQIHETIPSQWNTASLEIGYCFPSGENQSGQINAMQAAFVVSSTKYNQILSDITAFRTVFIAEMERMIRNCIRSNTLSFDGDDTDIDSEHTWETAEDLRVVFVIKDICYQYTHHKSIITQMLGIAYEIARRLHHAGIEAEILRIKDLDMTVNYASELKKLQRDKKRKKRNRNRK